MANRIDNEYKQLNLNPIDGICFEMDEKDHHNWTGTIFGPKDSPYENGIFDVKITFPPNYPIDAPTLIFITKIYHPSINNTGKLCTPILSKDWAPTFNICDVMKEVKSLLKNFDQIHDGENAEVSAQLHNDKAAFIKVAAQWTNDYAK